MATPSATPELDQDLALAGMLPDLAARIRADMGAAKVEAADCCLVRPDCWDIVMAWRVICGQWRTASPGGMAGGIVWMGLDYASVAAGLSGMGIEQTPDLWWGLRVMEAEAKGELNR